MNSQIHKIKADQKNIRLDIFLSSKFDFLSRSKIKKLIVNGQILINNQKIKPSLILEGGEQIYCDLEDSNDQIVLEPQNIELDILFEDEYFLVINKPFGMVVHPGNGNRQNTLANGLLYYLKNISSTKSIRPGIVHRLDKDTSGVIVTAKNDRAHDALSKLFQDRLVSKCYEAIIWGIPKQSKGIIQNYIIRDTRDKTAFKISDFKGKEAISEYQVIKEFGALAHIRLFPKTGRTHQLRVHMKHMGHPILADTKYSGGEQKIKAFHTQYTQLLKRCYKLSKRTMLHAKSISFIHPFTKKEVKFSVDLPSDMQNVIKLLKNEL